MSRLDRIRNEYIRRTAHVCQLAGKAREARLMWFGHVQRRNGEYVGRMLAMETPGGRKRGRPRRFIDAVKADMQVVGVTKEDTEDRLK